MNVHIVVFRADENNDLRSYYDGGITENDTYGTRQSESNLENWVGCSYDAYEGWNGYLDEVRISTLSLIHI